MCTHTNTHICILMLIILIVPRLLQSQQTSFSGSLKRASIRFRKASSSLATADITSKLISQFLQISETFNFYSICDET